MNETPSGNRLQIGIFGRRNAGKSSFINALTGQNIAIVSDTPGTTTDPVSKAVEIRGLGPVLVYDTAGLDDSGELGEKRVARSREVLKKVNFGVIITTYSTCGKLEEDIINEFNASGKQFIVLFNKIDIEAKDEEKEKSFKERQINTFSLSSTTGLNIDETRQKIVELCSKITVENSTILGDLIGQGKVVVLVVPIDLGAPKGRLILPQVQVIRDILDNDAIAVTVKERELQYTLKTLGQKPDLIVCDSQVVLKVAGDVAEGIKLTTFSILFSRLKGDLAELVRGVKAVDNLKNGDKVLIMEACTHHAQADDIGRVKIPRWLRQYTGKNLEFETNAGPYVSRDLSKYKLIVACGGCMINRQEMLSRMKDSADLNIPITNYGVLISYVQGVANRVLAPFPEVQGIL
jgi:[FeFe] hydrogenase H-cluster maturation GTPase HydF